MPVPDAFLTAALLRTLLPTPAPSLLPRQKSSFPPWFAMRMETKSSSESGSQYNRDMDTTPIGSIRICVKEALVVT